MNKEVKNLIEEAWEEGKKSGEIDKYFECTKTAQKVEEFEETESKCQRCGNYVRHGSVICGDCLEFVNGLQERLERFVAYHRGHDEEMGIHITDLVDDAKLFLTQYPSGRRIK